MKYNVRSFDKIRLFSVRNVEDIRYNYMGFLVQSTYWLVQYPWWFLFNFLRGKSNKMSFANRIDRNCGSIYSKIDENHPKKSAFWRTRVGKCLVWVRWMLHQSPDTPNLNSKTKNHFSKRNNTSFSFPEDFGLRAWKKSSVCYFSI